MKKVLTILGGIIVFIVLVISIVFMMTSSMSDAATAFFTEIKAKNYTQAYTYLSEDFKANTSEDEFVKFLDKSALLNFKETSWSSRSISGGKGELDGSVITENGGVVPIKLDFVKENELWKIYAIHKPQAGLTQSNASDQLPPVNELMKLTDESMLKFARSVNAKDFKEFHAYVSNLWQKQFTVEKFNDTFKPFMDANIDMVPALKANNPIFDKEPAIVDGVLALEGHYPTQPSRLMFKLEYIYEGNGWKLIGTSVNIK
ncbi:MAG: hypothetical protein PHU11_01005 [Dysgonamonadaceae bacterium]|nr:hypothetical protein [Sulfurovum sp.]MDD3494458.1 hypothetical protein [Dysgonamonadaceae bacterium]